MARPPPKLEGDGGVVSTYNPFRIAASVLRRSALYLLPPATSLRIAFRLVPLLVCLSLLPLILFFSLFSGWYTWRNVPVAWQVPIYLQYGDSPSPYAELSLPPLSTVQPYDVSIQLVLPASEANFALGNFMATLSLSTPSNKTLLTVSRPAIAIPPKRSTFSFSIAPRLIHLDVLLLSSHVPGASDLNARIDLGRRDGWRSLGNGQGRELSVWNAALRGTVRRRAVWGLVSRFPIVFAFVASAAFFSLSIIVLAACILPAVQRRISVDQVPRVIGPKEDRPTRVRKRSRRGVGGESHVPSNAYKSEDVPVDNRSTFASDDFPLRRRRSRISDAPLDSDN